MFVNCKSVNTKGVGDFYAFRVNDIITFIDCEAEASGGANGVGFSLTGNAPRAINCYAHNCTQSGIEVGTHYGLIQGCLVANNTDTGIWLRAEFGVTAVVNNTIYNSTVGLDITTVYQSTFYNNIISNCTTGALVDASDPSNFWDYNCYGNNTTDVTNITTGANSLLLTDPQFINPAGDDFRLKTSSPCLNTGLPFIGGSDSLFDGVSSMGGWQPWASPNPTSHRARYSGQSLYN
ncbi:hypothetical protein LCGC14_2244800 [marine sediment metagenome]|uniref:Right handed beta helix domain-containing protein n=1 Tax=marine sediment metagenome TaxID=412755 RepID=A0A0F9DRZ4_9ZZZZ